MCQNICREQHWASLCVPGAGGHELLEYVLVADYTMLCYRSEGRSLMYLSVFECIWVVEAVSGSVEFRKEDLEYCFQ